MKKLKNILFVSIILLTVSSCDDLFDITPENEITEKELYSTPSGYYNSLMGIYIELSANPIYSQELKYGIVEDLAQSFLDSNDGPDVNQIDERNSRKGIPSYDYDRYQYIEETLDPIFAHMYKVIANCNNLLFNLDKAKVDFPEGDYEILKGEALGIRAYLHFELLRLFAPSVAAGANAEAIPYVDAFELRTFPKLSVNQVLTKVIADLSEAERLLEKSDPLVVDDEVNLEFTDSESIPFERVYIDGAFRYNRGYRLNYYAVQGLLARIYLYAGDHANAYQYAKALLDSDFRPDITSLEINSNKLGLFNLYVDKEATLQAYHADFVNARNLPKVSIDNLFETILADDKMIGVNSMIDPADVIQRKQDLENNTYVNLGNYLTDKSSEDIITRAEIFTKLNYPEVAEVSWKQSFYDTYNSYKTPLVGDSDVRLSHVFERIPEATIPGSKFYKNYKDLENREYVSFLKYAEIYLIAAETVDDFQEGRSLLNSLRQFNGLHELTDAECSSKEQLGAEIEKEFRKEFVGEGQIFFYYKRKNASWFTGINGMIIQNHDYQHDIYVLPASKNIDYKDLNL